MSNYKQCLGARSQEPYPGPSIRYPTHLRDSKTAGGCRGGGEEMLGFSN